MKHGEERTKSTEVEAGKLSFRKREKFCIAHGWIDLFAIGGDLEWQRQHGKCGSNSITQNSEIKLAA